ncbi:fimbria/pilus outer membrane usher protein, partial [Serratia sp. CY74308]|uniref:fimbria/pilus outer membrane usher protein n=1 Tax=Serratia sp. CY74308 TaxID=3383675 RepID=UPI003FA0B76B
MHGGCVADQTKRNGITLSQSLGDTIALVEVPNAGNVEIINSTGVTTDWRGYAVVPYINSYHKNRINLNQQSFDDSVEIE